VEFKGFKEALDAVKHEHDIIAKAMDSKLHANVKVNDKLHERGSLSDRLAKNANEATTVKRVDDARLNQPTTEPDMSDEEMDLSHDEVVNRMVDDIMRKLFK
jgi:hypothetical protein